MIERELNFLHSLASGMGRIQAYPIKRVLDQELIKK
jgi:hypothetical protein